MDTGSQAAEQYDAPHASGRYAVGSGGAALTIQRVGHVILRVRDLSKAKAFYQGVLGMSIAAESDRAVFFRFGGYHHDIGVFRAAPDAELPKPEQVGLAHVAVLADDFETVKRMHARCKEMGVEIVGAKDHEVTKSLYIKDPEGNTIEIYWDDPSYDWQTKGVALVAHPLELDET
jgi:catechol 2,3-dioxygenase